LYDFFSFNENICRFFLKSTLFRLLYKGFLRDPDKLPLAPYSKKKKSDLLA